MEGQVDIGAAIQTGYRFLQILAVFFPLLYAVYILRSCMQGMGNSTIPMLSSLIQVLMRILCAAVLTKIIGNKGVFWGEVMAWAGADIFLAAHLFWPFHVSAAAAYVPAACRETGDVLSSEQKERI